MKINIHTDEDKIPTQKYTGRFPNDGSLNFDFGSYIKIKLKEYIKKNPGAAFEIKPILPESGKMRGFFEGSVCPLVAFYQDGMDHHNSKDIEKVREWLKLEFNGELVEVCGKTNKVAKSTKYQLNKGFLERVIDYIQTNFAPPDEVLDTKKYLDWKDRIYPYGGPDNWIDYLVELKVLKKE